MYWISLKIKVPLELTWKLIFHVPIYLYMFWVAYQKVRKGIRAARENIKRKPNVVMRNPNWQWLLGKIFSLSNSFRTVSYSIQYTVRYKTERKNLKTRNSVYTLTLILFKH